MSRARTRATAPHRLRAGFTDSSLRISRPPCSPRLPLRSQPSPCARSALPPVSAAARRELRVAARGGELDAILLRPAEAHALLLLAHGAGAGMRHAFMEAIADALAARGVATLRFQFPWMQRGEKRLDAPPVLHEAARAAFAQAERSADGLALFAGGKSLGGRMTSQVAAQGDLASARGIVFLGFPLHPAGKPGSERAAHLRGVAQPMLFAQGTRDALADLALLRPVVTELGARAQLHVEEDADHAFHVRKKSGRDDAAVIASLAGAVATFTQAPGRSVAPSAGAPQ
jgi:predicted alpha/beta-hydrolase family hydrolase